MPYDVMIRDDPTHSHDMDVLAITVGYTLRQLQPRKHPKRRMIRVGNIRSLIARVAGNARGGHGRALRDHAREIEETIDRQVAARGGKWTMYYPFATVVVDGKMVFAETSIVIADADGIEEDASPIRPVRASLGNGDREADLERSLAWRNPPGQRAERGGG